MRNALFTAALSSLSLACQSPARDAEQAIRRYDEAVSQAYRTSDPEQLGQVAMEREVRKVRALIDLKQQNRLILESTLESLEVQSAQLEGDRLQVRVVERWRYFDRPIDPGAAAGQVFVARMTLDYDLAKTPEGYKVAEARTVANEFLEPKGYQLPGKMRRVDSPAAPGAAAGDAG